MRLGKPGSEEGKRRGFEGTGSGRKRTANTGNIKGATGKVCIKTMRSSFFRDLCDMWR